MPKGIFRLSAISVSLWFNSHRGRLSVHPLRGCTESLITEIINVLFREVLREARDERNAILAALSDRSKRPGVGHRGRDFGWSFEARATAPI